MVDSLPWDPHPQPFQADTVHSVPEQYLSFTFDPCHLLLASALLVLMNQPMASTVTTIADDD